MIPGRCIEVSTNQGDIVLDPFGGGGSTYHAAQERKRYWIGSEIVDCSHIIQRFRENFPDKIRKFPIKKLTSIFR